MRYQTGRNLVREPSRCAPNRRVATVTQIGVEYQAPDKPARFWWAVPARVSAIAAAGLAAALLIRGCL